MTSKTYFESDSAVIPYRNTLKVEKLSTGAIRAFIEQGGNYCSTIITEPMAEKFLDEYRQWLGSKDNDAEYLEL